MGDAPWEAGNERMGEMSLWDGALKEYLETQGSTEAQKLSEKGVLWINACNQVSWKHLFLWGYSWLNDEGETSEFGGAGVKGHGGGSGQWLQWIYFYN